MATNSRRELIAVERKNRNLTLSSLLNDNGSYSSIENQLKTLKEEMETNFRHFNTFNDFVNAKLDVNKDENVHEVLRIENKNQQAIIKILIETSNKNRGTWKTVEKKTRSLNSKISSTKYETIALKNCFNILATSSKEFIEVNEDEESNDNVTIDNNPQKSQPEVKRRPNNVITQNNVRSQKIKTVPCDRM